MARIFSYCRVGTEDQTTDNQVNEIEAAGFRVDPKRVVSATVSGSVVVSKRKGFARLPGTAPGGILDRRGSIGRSSSDLSGRVVAKGRATHRQLPDIDLAALSRPGKQPMSFSSDLEGL